MPTTSSRPKHRDLPTNESAGFNVRRAHRAFDRLLNAYLQKHGLKTGYWYYLRVLWSQDGLTQRELSSANNVTENTTTSMINAMVADGLVVRVRDENDQRKWRINLTAHGKGLREGLLPYAAEVNRMAGTGIDPEDIFTCLRVLRAMSANLETALEQVEPTHVTMIQKSQI